MTATTVPVRSAISVRPSHHRATVRIALAVIAALAGLAYAWGLDSDPLELRNDIARGEFHLVLALPSHDARLVWIAQHCRHLPGSAPPFQSYYCVASDARPPS